MSCTLLVSKLIKSSEDKAEQEENMPFILTRLNNYEYV